MTVRIIVGNALDKLRLLDSASAHCVVTSPPYYGLREYGLEPSVWGGEPACAHDFSVEIVEAEFRKGMGLAVFSDEYRGGGVKWGSVTSLRAERGACAKCGAWLGCLGVEPTPDLYVEHMVMVLEECRRVLRDDGSLWLNLGDSYASATSKGSSGNGTSTLTNGGAYQDDAPRPWSGRPNAGASSWAGHRGAKTRAHRDPKHAGKHTAIVGSNRAQRGDGNGGVAYGPMVQPNRLPLPGLKPKDLIGIPWRVAFALRAAGWWLRQDIVWSKPNPMPESVTDRCTKAHEYLFLLTKSQDYFYDAAAIAEPAAYAPGCGWKEEKKGARPSKRKKQERAIDPEQPFRAIRETRNKRSVWTVPTKSFSGEFCRACRTYFEGADLRALRVQKISRDDGTVERIRHCRCGKTDAWLSHFATFPPELVEDCVRASTSERGCCSSCGAPHERVVERRAVPGTRAVKTHFVSSRDMAADGNDQGSNRRKDGGKGGYVTEITTTGWRPTCRCAAGVVPCTVLEPFGGAGTTAMVADRLGRDAVLLEMNPEYAEMARQRVNRDARMFAPATLEDAQREAVQ